MHSSFLSSPRRTDHVKHAWFKLHCPSVYIRADLGQSSASSALIVYEFLTAATEGKNEATIKGKKCFSLFFVIDGGVLEFENCMQKD